MHISRHLDSEPLNAFDLIGGQPLAASGFENEDPEPEFTETARESED